MDIESRRERNRNEKGGAPIEAEVAFAILSWWAVNCPILFVLMVGWIPCGDAGRIDISDYDDF
jgi:hypothetical protein